jgi:hypothetical protein
MMRTYKRKQRKQKKNRKQRKTHRRHRGGDYRIATVQSMEGEPLSVDAGVSIAGRSGIFTVKEAEEYKAKKMMGERS